jgi:hypothetical protein
MIQNSGASIRNWATTTGLRTSIAPWESSN